jgi:hypothetical protein
MYSQKNEGRIRWYLDYKNWNFICADRHGGYNVIPLK